jgi:hypothetical protein
MITQMITDELSNIVPDLIAVSALFLVAMLALRSLKLMSFASEFDRQYKNAAANASKFGDKSFFNIDDKAWKKEYIANRAGGFKRYSQQKKQNASFKYSRPSFTKSIQPFVKNIQFKSNQNKITIKSVKNKYGISSKNIKSFSSKRTFKPIKPGKVDSNLFTKPNPKLTRQYYQCKSIHPDTMKAINSIK